MTVDDWPKSCPECGTTYDSLRDGLDATVGDAGRKQWYCTARTAGLLGLRQCGARVHPTPDNPTEDG